ncbi:cytochrome P450 9b2-like [Toxorhynchites rutilus septentrionalis]|uniref:cytochrome P450 9b2-like n=1 Tax=Toxorhynchites rutilus septentrionalis TaxID=329112 RepID=UPI00247A803B|nr:cytochrome P450 9b2-like [Toxorhynchites rutilus septentrionalis]
MNVEDLYWFAFTIVTIVGFFTFKLITKHRHVFTARGVAFEKPHFLYGNQNDVLNQKVSSLVNVEHLYRKFHNERIFGFFNYLSPIFYIREPELIDKLWVHQFSHFSNHGYFLDESKDTILGNQLHLLKGDKWCQMRALLSPAFETRNVAMMCSLIRTNSLDLVDYLATVVNSELDSKDFFQKHTFNVIASCAFGLEVNYFNNDRDKFCEVGSSLVFGQNPMQAIKTMLFYLFPRLMGKMGIRLMEEGDVKYFLGVLRSTSQQREDSNAKRCNMIQFLNRIQNGELETGENDPEVVQMLGFAERKWTDEELIAQSVSFFGNGFESVVNLLSFAAYELTANPEVQEKLFAEIQTTLGDVPLTYESVSKMTYLDMVINETLRKWPAMPTLDRECSRDYDLNEGDYRLQFRKGDSVWVSTWALHRDEKYFPEPERFDPERFNVENKLKIIPHTYLPFGVGPRNCIGIQFALLVAKITLIDVLRNFQLRPGDSFTQNLTLAKGSFSLEPEAKGFCLQLCTR